MIRRLLVVAPALLLVLVVAFGGYVWWVLDAALPDYSGELTLPGLVTPVRVITGPHGVPSIEAESIQDLMLAQGYIVARERMWQMDLLRRLADGRLAEVFGPQALPADKLFRTMGLGEDARRALADLEPSYRGLLEAYARGVNAYIGRAKGRLPIEYRISRLEPEPWQPADSLAIGAYMAWTQSFNLREELSFLRIAARIGAQRARQLFPADEGVPAPPVSSDLPADLAAVDPALPTAIVTAMELPAAFGLPLPSAASNAWAVTGGRTTDGSAMLANDPHLAASTPGIWYELELETPGLHVAGVALPGVPLVLIGHNEHLAWGFTSVIADTQDVFLERPSASGDAVDRPGGGTEPIETRLQRIKVKGADPVTLRVRSTSNGVLLNDLLAARDWIGPGSPPANPLGMARVSGSYLLALRRNNDLPDRGFAALYRLSQATTLDEARQAVLGFRYVAQNLMLAQRDGGIAWQVSGQLPKRGKGSGAFPVPGWIQGYAWKGYEPQDRNPTLTDPEGLAIVTANNRSVPLDYSVTVSNAWMPPYRAQRIRERLAESGPLTPASMAEIQVDNVSIQARHTQAALRGLTKELRRDPEAWVIAQELLAWNAEMDAESHAAAVFALLEPALYRALYEDELGEELPVLMAMGIIAYNPVQETIRSGASAFWDDVRTQTIEEPAEIWARALRDADAGVRDRLPNPADQRLERLRSLTFPHAFHAIPYLGRLFDVGPIGTGGATDTVNVRKSPVLDPSRAYFIPSVRMIQTPGDWSQTRGTLPLGQSGHLFSPYREDQLEDWLAGRTHPWPWNGPPGDSAASLLVLSPAKHRPD